MTLALPVDPSLCTPAERRDLGGLIALVEGVERALPLTSVRVRATITGTVCRTVMEQHFANRYPQPVEAVHLFPLPPGAAVVEAELVAGDLTVRAECRERGAAERTFTEARAAGHRAMLVTEERPDVFTLRVTNLPPGEGVTVRLVIVEALAVEDGRATWRFPTVIAPRYLPGTPGGHAGPGVAPDTDHAPDASRLSPPLRLAGGTPLDLEVWITGRPSSVAASQHAVRLELGDGVRVAPSGTPTLDRDFVLAIGWDGGADTAVRAWTDGTHTLIHVVPPMASSTPLPRDAVFVVDISGSMEGVKLAAARRALSSALHGLVPGDRFRLVAFDDRIEHFAPGFTPYDDASLARADRWIAALAARGGTEMLAPLVAALDGDRVEGRVHTVLFITDGQAYNDHELMAAVAGRRRGALVFTLGIDTAVNASLLQGLARVGGGACTLCTPSDDIDAVVARVEARFGSPVATEVRAGDGSARPDPTTLFTGQPGRFVLEGAPGEVVITGRTAAGPWSVRATPVHQATPLGAVWARERVAWLEDRLIRRPFEEEAIRPEIVRIGEAFGISSRFTAFVAEERTRVVGGGQPQVVVQPVELPAGWERSREVAGGGARLQRAGAGIPLGARPRSPQAAPPPPSSAPPGFLGDLPDADVSPMVFESAAAPAPKAAPSPVRAVLGGLEKKLRAAFDREEAAPAREGLAPDALLAATQGADGSYGGDVRRTVAALVTLVLLGHTRRAGLRKRTVTKAAAWLGAHRGEAEVDRALALLDDAEAGRPLDRAWRGLHDAGAEGRLLAGVV